MMVFKPINIDINYSFPLNDKMMLDYGDALILEGLMSFKTLGTNCMI